MKYYIESTLTDDIIDIVDDIATAERICEENSPAIVTDDDDNVYYETEGDM